MYKETITQAAAAAGDDPPTKIRAALNQDQYLCCRFFSQTYHECKQSGDHGIGILVGTCRARLVETADMLV